MLGCSIERDLLRLPAAERERIVLLAWESLVSDPDAAANADIDPKGIRMAEARDKEIEAIEVTMIDQDEFRRLTGGD